MLEPSQRKLRSTSSIKDKDCLFLCSWNTNNVTFQNSYTLALMALTLSYPDWLKVFSASFGFQSRSWAGWVIRNPRKRSPEFWMLMKNLRSMLPLPPCQCGHEVSWFRPVPKQARPFHEECL